MNTLYKFDPQVAAIIAQEERRIEETIDLIASENYAYQEVMEATGSVLTNKYAEGYPGVRYYGGCEQVDHVENLARERLKKLFGADHANVQPHSGAQANMSAYYALLNPGDTILGMSLSSGGHLTHGYPINFSGKWYKAVNYGVNKETELLDYDAIEKLALEHKPQLIIAGASAYSRTIDFAKFREIADKVGAKLMVDMAHIAGLVAVGLHPSPVPFADVITSTTHKTLRGPRGGFILCKAEYAKKIDSAVMPGIQGGPQMHHIAAKAVGFLHNLSDDFKLYAQEVVENAKIMSDEFIKKGYRVVAGGTDNHLFTLDLRSKNLTGKQAEQILERAGINVNKNCIPYDPQSPLITSGIRIGSPAITSRGFRKMQALQVVEFIDTALTYSQDDQVLATIAYEVRFLCAQFPVYTSSLNFSRPATFAYQFVSE
ncbi:MAG: serine hydroxymethyltransferase [Gammaproteobacteria bacterium]|nr:serine hydroxymethyltransferase [Gammaproteobacteria bacterium]